MSKKETKALATRGPRELTEFEEDLQREALEARESVKDIGGGAFISIKGGKMKIGDRQIPNGKLPCIILGHVAAKAYYPNGYDQNKSESPVCYAFGPKLKGLTAHAEAPAKQFGTCDDCKHNAFGTAIVGDGKACKDQIRLAVVECGSLEDGAFDPYGDSAKDLTRLQTNEVYKLSIPAKSLKSFAKYLKDVTDTSQRPLYCVYTVITASMGDGDFPEVSFESFGDATPKQIAVLRGRRANVIEDLTQPYPKIDGSKGGKGGKGGPSKDAAKGARKSSGKRGSF